MGQSDESKKRPKCKFWDECYRKDRDHKNTFLHPEDDKVDNECEWCVWDVLESSAVCKNECLEICDYVMANI